VARFGQAGSTTARSGARKDVHERALGLLAVRQRSRQELQGRLLQAGFEPEEVGDELDRLERVGLLDDQAFARAVVESRVGRRGESHRMVAGKLTQAGVDAQTAMAAIDDLGGDEQDRADALARQKAVKMGGLEPHVASQRLFGFLARRGYGPEVARVAARRALAVDEVSD
jgi:regulatory protein